MDGNTEAGTQRLPVLRASTACPTCRKRHVLDIKAILQARPLGTYSLAGAQVKVSAVMVWRAVCTTVDCGFTARAEGPPGVTPENAATLEPEGCGHVDMMGHWPTATGSHADTCPGCCPTCQDIQDIQDRAKGWK